MEVKLSRQKPGAAVSKPPRQGRQREELRVRLQQTDSVHQRLTTQEGKPSYPLHLLPNCFCLSGFQRAKHYGRDSN